MPIPQYAQAIRSALTHPGAPIEYSRIADAALIDGHGGPRPSRAARHAMELANSQGQGNQDKLGRSLYLYHVGRLADYNPHGR